MGLVTRGYTVHYLEKFLECLTLSIKQAYVCLKLVSYTGRSVFHRWPNAKYLCYN